VVDAVIRPEDEFDVEASNALARDGCLRWLCEFTRLAGYVFGGCPGHGCQDRGDFFGGAPRQIVIREDLGVPKALLEYTAYTVDLPKVVAGSSCAGGLGVTTLRHLVLLL